MKRPDIEVIKAYALTLGVDDIPAMAGYIAHLESERAVRDEEFLKTYKDRQFEWGRATRLEAENAKLREALELIGSPRASSNYEYAWDRARGIAFEALKEKEMG